VRVGTLEWVAAIVLAVVASASLTTHAAVSGDKALRTVSGTVLALEVVPAANGESWLEATVAETETSEPLRLRIGPGDILTGSGFDMRPGDSIQLRYFVGDAPMDVQRVRNARTGRVLRLRGLYGDPLWTSFGAGSRGPAASSPGPGPRPDRRGGRH
jgi:hypothetical protein